ncbi:MAG: hypothetical protein ACLRJV_16530 [Eubacteriales bacterium]
MITLLSAQLAYFTSLEESQLRNIDYITKRYGIDLKLKPTFGYGMDALSGKLRLTRFG